MTNRICKFPSCGRKHRARGYCSGHYQQDQAGNLLSPIVDVHRNLMDTARTEADYFWARVEKTEACWNWTGTKIHLGYGQFRFGGLRTSAHRYAWALDNGPIPDGAHIDHICHNSSCVNPKHLRTVTHKQNMENRVAAHVNSKSGVRGVYWDKQVNKWRATIRHNGKNIHLGYFTVLDDAAAAARAGRAKYFTHAD